MLSNAIALIAVAAMFGVEAYKATGRLPRAVLASIAAAFALAGLLLQPISTAAPQLGQFVAGAFASPASWFVLFMGLFFVLRPFWQKRAPIDLGQPSTYDDSKLREEVSELGNTVRAVIADYQKMSGLTARFADEIAGSKMAVQGEAEAREMADKVIERKANEAIGLVAKVEDIRVDTAIAQRDIEKLTAIQEEHRNRVQSSLHAIHMRERLVELQAVIELDAADLYDPLSRGERYDRERWQRWENVHGHWQSALSEWLDTATWYAVDVKKRTLAVDDEMYGRGWTISDTQFPDAEAVRIFKKFRIIQQQWEAVVPSVKSGLEQVAFVGLTEAEVRSGLPAR